MRDNDFAAPEGAVTSRRHLAYTIALDPPGAVGHRSMAKVLAGSLLRTFFGGDVVVFRNTEDALFPLGRRGLEEVCVETPDYGGVADRQEAWRYKFRVREHLDVSGYDKVLFLDADCLVLRNIDHLLDGDWDIAWMAEGPGRPITLPQFHCFLTDEEMRTLGGRPGANSGTLAVRAEIYDEVMAEWERIDLGPTTRTRHCSDQASWNRLLLDADQHGWRTKRFERDEVQFPLFLHPNYHDYKDAAILHGIGGTVGEKRRFLWGMYLQTYYYDVPGTLLNLLEM
jgi:hypothetical protein